MKLFRARIRRINVSSLKCEICPEEVTEEIAQKYLDNGKHEFIDWLDARADRSKKLVPKHATFKLRNKQLYDYALSLIDANVLLGIENAEIASIEKYERSNLCHFCSMPTLQRNFNDIAICSKGDTEKKFCNVVAIKDNDLSQHNLFSNCESSVRNSIHTTHLVSTKANEEKWVNREDSYMYRRDSAYSTIIKTKFEYTYYAHESPVCDRCVNKRYPNKELKEKGTFKIPQILRALQGDFENNLKIYTIHMTLIAKN